ncbi:MAG: hypothetical protein VB859_12750, partial [Planctomycetaceae bacterium]
PVVSCAADSFEFQRYPKTVLDLKAGGTSPAANRSGLRASNRQPTIEASRSGGLCREEHRLSNSKPLIPQPSKMVRLFPQQHPETTGQNWK